MNTKGNNRSVRRTRANLRKGLLELLQEKPANEITVRELSERANINRGTFYLHYRDIYDMISRVEEELFEELQDILEAMDTVEDPATDFTVPDAIFQFAEKNTDACAVFMGPNGDVGFMNRIRQMMQDRFWQYIRRFYPNVDRGDYDMFYAFAASGLTGIISEWLGTKDRRPSQEVAKFTMRMMRQSATVLLEG